MPSPVASRQLPVATKMSRGLAISFRHVSVSRSASHRWGRRLLFAAILLLSWAAIVAATGGFRIEIGPLRFSSRNATRIAYAGAILALVAWRLAYREHVRQAARALPGLLRRTEGRFAATTERFAHACESRGVGHRAGAPRGRDPLRQPRRRGRRCLRLSQRSRAARLGQTRHRPVLRGGTALAECRRFIRAARLPARRERRHGPDRRAGPAAADGVRGNALGLWTLSRRAALRRTPRARNLLARSTPVRCRRGAGRGGAGGLQSSGRLRIPRRDGGRTGGGVLDLGACRGVATDGRQHAWRGRAVGHRDPDPPEPVAARRVSLAARSLPRAECESGWCANGALCVGERSGSPRHRVHQSPHPGIRIHLGLWRSRDRLHAQHAAHQPQALLGMVAREPGDRRRCCSSSPCGHGAPACAARWRS